MMAVILLVTTEALKSVDSAYFHSIMSYGVTFSGINRQQRNIPSKMKLLDYWEVKVKRLLIQGS
jgi:hypothetical protein